MKSDESLNKIIMGKFSQLHCTTFLTHCPARRAATSFEKWPPFIADQVISRGMYQRLSAAQQHTGLY